jgi:hypothetical protein
MSRVLFIAACIAAGIAVPASPAADPEPLVSLLISKVTAKPVGPDILVTCEVTIDNDTGRDLTVRSGFFSTFDGLEIVVTNREGKVLTQKAYMEHQAVYKLFDGRDFPLNQGKTVKELKFPLDDLPKGTRSLRVRLVGTLPGSTKKRILSSETLAVEIDKGNDK